VTDPEGEARRAKSAALFNNRHFAECAVYLLDASNSGAEFVTVRQIAAASQLADSLVRPVLLRLVDAGVLEKLTRLGGGRSPQYYRVVDAQLLAWVSLTTSVNDQSTAR
jgi:predicted transcriptional regulator of viral defense system